MESSSTIGTGPLSSAKCIPVVFTNTRSCGVYMPSLVLLGVCVCVYMRVCVYMYLYAFMYVYDYIHGHMRGNKVYLRNSG